MQDLKDVTHDVHYENYRYFLKTLYQKIMIKIIVNLRELSLWAMLILDKPVILG